MSPPKRQHPAIGLRLIGDHLAQVSLPHLERGAFLRQPLELIINDRGRRRSVGQHGKPIVARNAEPANPVATVRRRSCGVGRSALRLATVDRRHPHRAHRSRAAAPATDCAAPAARARRIATRTRIPASPGLARAAARSRTDDLARERRQRHDVGRRAFMRARR